MEVAEDLKDEWPETGLPLIATDIDVSSGADDIFSLTWALAQTKIQWVCNGLAAPTNIAFVYLDSNEFGAWAVPLRHRYVVAVSAGTLASLLDFSGRLFAAWVPGERRWVRKPYPENWEPTTGPLIDSWRRGAFIPGDYETRVRAVTLARRIAAFVLDHELAHIMLGHCDFTYGSLGAYRIDAAISALTSEEALISQAMELQADRFAAMMSVDPVLGVPDVTPGFNAIRERFRGEPTVMLQLEQLKAAFKGLIGSRQSEVFSTLLSQYSMFRLFEDHHWSVSSLETASHPPSPMRFTWAVQGMKFGFRSMGDGPSLGAVRRAEKRIRRSAEQLFASAVGRRANGVSFEAARSPAANLHLGKLLGTSDALMHLLKPLYRVA
jgi:hypothetical protein